MGQVIEMRRRYGGGVLPYDAEIEYLEADGDSYIDTGLKILKGVSGTIRLQVKGVITGYKSDATYRRSCLVSCYQPIGPFKGFRIGRFYNADNSSKVYIQWSNGAREEVAPYGTVFNLDIMHSLDNVAHSTPLSLFVYWDNLYGQKWTSKGRIYYCNATINDNVVADLIPVRRGNVGCVYDKVSRQLFGNAGTGTFVVGPDVVGGVVTRCNIGVYVALGEERRAA